MKTRRVRSAIPIYIAAGVWLLLGLMMPLYRLPMIILAAAISVGAYFGASMLFPGRVEEVMPTSGDAAIDAQIAQCRTDLAAIQAANDKITSPEISKQIDRVEAAGAKILLSVTDKKERANDVRKFMNYYLPTTSKLLTQYQSLSAMGTSGEEITRAMSSVVNSLDMISGAFEKQLDNLYKDEALDMTTDVSVLETMMKGDGLTDGNVQKLTAQSGGTQ